MKTRNPTPRLKWHMLRRRKSDAPFQRENLIAALRAGAACEVDLTFTADGHALCLHDSTLDRETTGHGRVADATRAEIERLRQRSPTGAVLTSQPLFLDEVCATVVSVGVAASALVQLDVKARAQTLNTATCENFARALGHGADAFIASAYEWSTVARLVAAARGLHAGFDPLLFYPRTLDLDADAYRAIATRTLATAPGASIYYLEARLILAALERGVNLVREVTVAGARVDAWTIDPEFPNLHDALQRLLDAGVGQITTNDPEQLGPIVTQIATAAG